MDLELEVVGPANLSTAEEDQIPMEETRFDNGMFKLAPKGIENPRSLLYEEKKALDAKHTALAEKAQWRQDDCWMPGCDHRADIWVREVGFDFKGEKAAPVQHVAVSSADYQGPVPGFCHFCVGFGPERLAEAVYFDRPEMYWGVRPTRWFISFTDGTRQGGLVIDLHPDTQVLPKIVEEHIRGDHNNG